MTGIFDKCIGVRWSDGNLVKTIGIFGGTFDPVHNGHVQMALAAKSLLNLDEVRLLPCHHPPHRGQPTLSSQQRLHLLELSVESYPDLVVDNRELCRPGPSWTVDTLKDFRREFGSDVSLVLLIGADAYAQLNQWHQWQMLPALAHIGVFLRPGYPHPQEGILPERCVAIDDHVLNYIHHSSAGALFCLQQRPIDVSATEIREQLLRGEIPDGLSPSVQRYIIENKLYGFGL